MPQIHDRRIPPEDWYFRKVFEKFVAYLEAIGREDIADAIKEEFVKVVEKNGFMHTYQSFYFVILPRILRRIGIKPSRSFLSEELGVEEYPTCDVCGKRIGGKGMETQVSVMNIIDDPFFGNYCSERCAEMSSSSFSERNPCH